MPVRFLCKPDSARFWNGVESRSPRRCYGIKSVPLTCLWCTLRDAIFSFLCNPGSEQPGGMHLGPQNCSGFSHFRICWGSAIVEAAMSRSRGIPYTVYRFLLQQFISIKLFHFEYETIQFGSYIILTRSILLIPQAPSGLSVSLTNSDFAMSSPICRGWNIRNNIWWPAGWCQIVSNALPISSCIAHSIPFRIRDHPQSWWKSHSEAEVSVTCRESGVFFSTKLPGFHRKEPNPKNFNWAIHFAGWSYWSISCARTDGENLTQNPHFLVCFHGDSQVRDYDNER